LTGDPWFGPETISLVGMGIQGRKAENLEKRSGDRKRQENSTSAHFDKPTSKGMGTQERLSVLSVLHPPCDVPGCISVAQAATERELIIPT